MSTTSADEAADPGALATVTSEHANLPKHDLPVLEAFRGIAALMVVFTHVGFISGVGVVGPWAGWLSRLDFGVTLFFLLSGFLLFRPFVQAAYGRRPAVPVGSYFRRRFVRIYPAFIVVLIFNYLITPAARQAGGSLWLETLFMIQNYRTNFVNQLTGLVQCWSLAVEVSFYLALPFIAWFLLGQGTAAGQASAQAREMRALKAATGARTAPTWRREPRYRRVLGFRPQWHELTAARPGLLIGAMVAFSIAWRIFYTIRFNGLDTKLLWLPSFLDWFGAGMFLAWLRERDTPVPQVLRQIAGAPGACWSLALAGYWLITTQLGGPYGLGGPTSEQAMLKHLAFLVIAALALMPAVFGDPSAGWRRTASNRFFTWIGQISFGLFLWHPMLMDAIRRVLGFVPFDGHFWITLLMTLAASGVAATLSWKYLEERCQRRWRNGFRARRAVTRL
jgi:peptidoglycan/LPS O-acetylase OafA/YrhL